jgi:hypothetical protein
MIIGSLLIYPSPANTSLSELIAKSKSQYLLIILVLRQTVRRATEKSRSWHRSRPVAAGWQWGALRHIPEVSIKASR